MKLTPFHTPNKNRGSSRLSSKVSSLSIAAKIALVITTVIITGMGLLSLFILGNQSSVLNQQTDSYAAALGNQLSAAAIEPLLASDLQAVGQLTVNLADNEGIEGVAIFSDQRVPLSTIGNIPKEDPDQLILHSPLQWQSSTTNKLVDLTSYTSVIRFRDLNVGYYIITFDRSFMDLAYGNTIRTISVITILMVAFSIMIALLLSKRISRPIKEIVEGSRKIAQGDHQFRFKEHRTDELGQLMKSLNNMTEGLLRKEQVENVFSRYVSPNVAGSLMNDLTGIHLGGSHVEASVLFADISGFTTISEGLEPVTINNLLNDYFTLIDEIAGQYRGHIDKYIGDCAMILFGAPRADEEHSLNAVRCAVKIQHIIREFNQKRQLQSLLTVEFCIGINSGTMLAGNIGSENRMEYTVVGNAVNLASRLASVATAGQIIVTKKLHDALVLDTHFITSYSSITKLRGKIKPVEVWQVVDYLKVVDTPAVETTTALPSRMIH
jgi:adenylate cyclase